ncbi:MAG: hypothetical protein RLZZ184_3593, partial [Cyanobacteriota bacterium]
LAGCAKEFNGQVQAAKYERKSAGEVSKIFVNKSIFC